MRFLQGLCAWCLAAVLLPAGPVRAQSQLVLAIGEGASGGLDHGRVIPRYQGLAQEKVQYVREPAAVTF